MISRANNSPFLKTVVPQAQEPLGDELSKNNSTRKCSSETNQANIIKKEKDPQRQERDRKIIFQSLVGSRGGEIGKIKDNQNGDLQKSDDQAIKEKPNPKIS